MRKACNKCGVPKELHLFAWTHNGVKKLRRSTCSACRYKREKPTLSKARIDQFRYKVKKAGRPPGKSCEICDVLFSKRSAGGKSSAHYDHDHKTGKFRGWICKHCNWGLGHARDNPRILARMISYLRK